MDKRRLLWILVGLDLMLAFASVGAEGFFGWTLPSSLAEYQHARFSGSPFSSPGDVFHVFLLAVTTLFAFSAWISLVSFWRHARRLYLFSLALGMLLLLFSGPLVQTPVGAVFSAMNALVGGAILGLVHFSDLARRFERTADERTASAGVNLGTGRA